MQIKSIVVATAVVGSLDLAAAAVLAAQRGQSVVSMLQTIASGPFGGWPHEAGAAGAIAGAGVHFAIMTAMVLAFALLRRYAAYLRHNRLLPGALYGAALYVLMYWLVLPLRWPDHHPQTGLFEVLEPLVIHVFVVGFPMAWIVWEPRSQARLEPGSLAT